MNVNLAKEALYEDNLFKAARAYFANQCMDTKRVFDREATFFKQHALRLHPKIEDNLDHHKPVNFVIGADKNRTRVVSIFNAELFTNTTKLKKQVQSQFKVVEPFVKLETGEKINFNIVGVTVNMKTIFGEYSNAIVACGDFVSSAYIHNFCHLD